MMEEEPVEVIRESRRSQLLSDRKKHKNQETDVRRSLANLKISQSDVVAIINKLKTKSSISSGELQILQNAILDNADYTDLVLNTHGALRGLVRELSGNNASKQCLSCGCICNMALSEEKVCVVLCKAAAAYLLTTVDSCSTQLAVNCLWSVGNLAGSGPRAAAALVAGGAAKCGDVITAGDRSDAALYACIHLAYTLGDELRPDLLHKMIASLSKIEINVSSSQLLFYLSCHKDFTPDNVPDSYLQKLLTKLSVSMHNHVNNCKTITKPDNLASKCCEYVFLVRILANLNNDKLYAELVSYFLDNDLVQVSKKLLNDSDESLWWLFGNIFNVCGENVLFEQLVNDV